MMSGRDFIGKGWRFPIKVNTRGGLSWSEGPGRIQDAIWLIIATGLGERVMRPRFGAGVHDFVFQPNSPLTRTTLAESIKHALVEWEPRIDLEVVRVDPVPDEVSQVLVTIEYRVRTTNELFNMVYPFYLEEGVS
jgi:phage baseplate assembly protein W